MILARSLGLCVLATVGVGCQPSSPEPKPTEATAQAEPVAFEPAPAKPSGPAMAYVNVAHAGVFVLDDAGWRLVFSSRSPVRDLTVIDDQLVVLTSFGIQRVEGLGKAEPLAPLDADSHPQLGEPRAMAGDGERFWVVGDQAVGRWDRGWTLTPWTDVGKRDPTNPITRGPHSIVLDSAANPWVIHRDLVRHTGEAWTNAMQLGSELLVNEIVGSHDRSTILIHSGCRTVPDQPLMRCELIQWGDTYASFKFEPPRCADFGVLAVNSDGTRAAVASACSLVELNLTESDGAPNLHTVETGDWVGGTVRAVALDDRGRIWAGIGHSLVIVDDTLERYPLARLTDISGAVDQVYVSGAGPTAPTLGDERRGGLKATLLRGDQPIANAKVELCRDPRTAGSTPPDTTQSACTGADLASTTTDAEGKLEVADLPLGEYTFAVELDGRWGIGVAKSPTMRVGMTGNIGKIPIVGLD